MAQLKSTTKQIAQCAYLLVAWNGQGIAGQGIAGQGIANHARTCETIRFNLSVRQNCQFFILILLLTLYTPICVMYTQYLPKFCGKNSGILLRWDSNPWPLQVIGNGGQV